MTENDTLTAWDLRRRLGLAAAADGQTDASPAVLIRQICARRAEMDALATGTPAWRAADLAEQELRATLARGSLTPDGIEWLIRQLDPRAPTRSALGSPPTPMAPEAPASIESAAPTPRSSRRRAPSGAGTPRRRSLRSAGT